MISLDNNSLQVNRQYLHGSTLVQHIAHLFRDIGLEGNHLGQVGMLTSLEFPK